jgi:serine/threonine protein kinase
VWALGVLLYELLHGFAPFEGETVAEVREAMLQGEIHIDPELSNNVQNLIFNILKVDPNERISIENIKTHPWMREMKKLKLMALNSILHTQQDNDNSGSDETVKELSKKEKENKINVYDKKTELLKAVNRTLMVAKNKKKQNPHFKTNTSLDHHGSTVASSNEKLKQK